MPENRFFAPIRFQKEALFELQEDEGGHLRVMRRKEGDLIELINGQNQLARAQIRALKKKSAELLLLEVQEFPPPQRQIVLAQALLKPSHLDLVIEKGTELGATSFWLFPGERSEKKSLTINHLHRLHHLMISAIKQCGRLDLPKLVVQPSLEEWPPPSFERVFFGDPVSQEPYSPSSSDILFFVGPEKGFSQSEKTTLHNSFKAKGIRLNPHILRAETASLCALSIISTII